jgi:S1-C subfamily serine protease
VHLQRGGTALTLMRYMAAVLLLVAAMSAQNAPSTNKGNALPTCTEYNKTHPLPAGVPAPPSGFIPVDKRGDWLCKPEGVARPPLPPGASELTAPSGRPPLDGPKHPKKSTPQRKNVAAIAKEAKGAVVSILMSDKEGHPVAQGSGFLISKDGRVVTNYHVIKSGSSAIIKLPYGAFFAVDGVLAFDKARDVAIIKAHGANFRPLTLGDSSRLQIGEEVVAISSPLLLESTVSNGIVSGVRTIEKEGGKLLQITAPISPGSSGGPLFNMAGEVIGITTSHLRGGENLNFAIPTNDMKPMLGKLSEFPDGLPLPDEADKAEPTNVPSTTQNVQNGPDLEETLSWLLPGRALRHLRVWHHPHG